MGHPSVATRGPDERDLRGSSLHSGTGRRVAWGLSERQRRTRHAAVAEKAAGGTNAAGAEKVGVPLDARMKVVCGIYATKAAARKARTARTSIARVAITVG